MGWDGSHAVYYREDGKIDRKAECDALYTNKQCRVLKSSMVGTTYYAAVEKMARYVADENGSYHYEELPDSEREVFAVVALTSTESGKYFNFYVKTMPEDMGPYQCSCPASILKLLTPTTDEYALNWREHCKEYHNRKNGKSISALPVGTTIQFNYCGKTRRATKRAPGFQFKTPWWLLDDGIHYIQKKNIPFDYQIVV